MALMISSELSTPSMFMSGIGPRVTRRLSSSMTSFALVVADDFFAASARDGAGSCADRTSGTTISKAIENFRWECIGKSLTRQFGHSVTLWGTGGNQSVPKTDLLVSAQTTISWKTSIPRFADPSALWRRPLRSRARVAIDSYQPKQW